jgi:hypothetical protein
MTQRSLTKKIVSVLQSGCRSDAAIVSALLPEASLLARDPALRRLKRQFVALAKQVIMVRIPISICIVVIAGALQPPHAKALTSKELVESCKSVEQSAQSGPGDTLGISPEGLPCWYYMSAVQNLSALVDNNNERLIALCPPTESTTLDFVRVFLRSAGHSDQMGVDTPAVLVLRALTKVFPCHEGRNR